MTMRFCLFKPGRRLRLLALGPGTLTWLALNSACGGQKFTAHEGPSVSGAGSGSGGAGAGGEPGGEAGESGSPEGGSGGSPSAGSSGASPSAGSAGKGTVGCDCTAGQYCQDGTSRCRPCAEFTRFEFGPAEKLTTLSGSPSVERFPRSAGAGSQLLYVSGAADQAKILYSAAPVSGMGTTVSGDTQIESGPVYANGFADQNLFFDREVAGHRKLLMALWTAPTSRTKEALMAGAINAAGFDDYSIALSANTGHVYWMSTRNGEPQLLWQPTSTSAPPAPAVLALRVKAGSAECPRSGDDATPWVNAAGTLLLFRNPSLDENCEVNDSGATDLYAAPLDKGIATAAAVPLASLNHTGGMSWETDPSLSPDSCTIYFASDNDRGDFDLYKASRD